MEAQLPREVVDGLEPNSRARIERLSSLEVIAAVVLEGEGDSASLSEVFGQDL